jgi:hypothetical protein
MKYDFDLLVEVRGNHRHVDTAFAEYHGDA